jgi:hypothetical protein
MMLAYANAYKDKLAASMIEISKNIDKYKYYIFAAYHDFSLSIDENTWNSVSMVSLYEGEIIGYFKALISQPERFINSLSIINFEVQRNVPFIFMKDLFAFIDILFTRYKMNKIVFKVAIGNKAEKMYDSIIEKYGGVIVGVFTKDVMLSDGEYYDVKFYEIMRDNYLRSKRESRSRGILEATEDL